MKTNLFLLTSSLTVGALLAAGSASTAQAAPKRVLVVSVTKGFRHSVIPLTDKVIGELAQSSGAFTVDYVRTDEDMAQKMTADALKTVDAVVFNNTTGDLPLPDVDAFLKWIEAGHGFLGIHAATDTFRGHKPLHAYNQMIGGEFKTHGAQVEVEVINQDPPHPACKPFSKTVRVFDEIYLLDGFERDTVHGLLTLDKHPNDKTPGDYPIAWCKNFGKGRVFYTSLGHREDVVDPKWGGGDRKNPPEVAEAYQKHLLAGIKWVLGLEKGSAKPQTAK